MTKKIVDMSQEERLEHLDKQSKRVDEPPVSFPKVVWEQMSRVDVGEFIVKKADKYDYLPWAWCVATLMRHYPESFWTFGPSTDYPDGTVMINCTVHIVQGDNELVRSMHLPVLNHVNKAIVNPDAMAINSSRMRCLVKALAVSCGLGLDLWTDSDMPLGVIDDPISKDKTELLAGMFDKLDEQGQKGFLAWLDISGLAEVTESQYQRARHQLERKVKDISK